MSAPALALTLVGSILTATSLTFIALGHFWRRRKAHELWRDQQVLWDPTEQDRISQVSNKSVNFVFLVHENSNCHMTLRPRTGPFRLSLAEMPIGVAPAPGSRWEYFSKFDTRPSFDKTEEVFDYDLSPGSYVLQFLAEQSRLEAFFDLKLTYILRPLVSLVDRGLTLFTMSLPIFVTGFVTLFF